MSDRMAVDEHYSWRCPAQPSGCSAQLRAKVSGPVQQCIEDILQLDYGGNQRPGRSRLIFIASTGIYNIQFSAQLDKTGGSASNVYIWPRVNGQNVPYSATKIVIDGPNNEIVPAWNFLLDLKAGDYFELAWQSPDTAVVILAEPESGNIPAIPSIILTMTYVSRLEI
jgi:hypothetical protein